MYDWTVLDNWFDDVTSGANGKKAVLVIMPVSGKDPSKADHWDNTATPGWLLDILEDQTPTSGVVTYVNTEFVRPGAPPGEPSVVRYPIFWNATYQSAFEDSGRCWLIDPRARLASRI